MIFMYAGYDIFQSANYNAYESHTDKQNFLSRKCGFVLSRSLTECIVPDWIP